MPVFRRLTLNLDSSTNIALAAACLLLLDSFAVVKVRAPHYSNPKEWRLSHPAQVSANASSPHDMKDTVLATGQASTSSVTDFMRAPAMSADLPNLVSLDPSFQKKFRSPSFASSSPTTPPTPLATTSASMSLPWKAVEPVRFGGDEKANTVDVPNQARTGGEGEDVAALSVPSTANLRTWVKANVKTFKGSERRRSLIHFELWLDPPKDIRDRMSSVKYDLRSDVVQPRKQESKNANAGFRAGFGGFGCAREILITVHFDDGRSQTFEVDGCALMASTR